MGKLGPLNNDTLIKNIFFTVSYRFDADFHRFMGYIYDKDTNMEIAPSKLVKWKQPDNQFNDANILEYVKNKTKPIFWFVSNCVKNPSKRMLFSKELSKHIAVDRWGCGIR